MAIQWDHQYIACSGLPCVIAVVDSDVVHDRNESRIICDSLGFLRCFNICFARHGVVYLQLRIISWRSSGLDPQDLRVHMDVHED